MGKGVFGEQKIIFRPKPAGKRKQRHREVTSLISLRGGGPWEKEGRRIVRRKTRTPSQREAGLWSNSQTAGTAD